MRKREEADREEGERGERLSEKRQTEREGGRESE